MYRSLGELPSSFNKPSLTIGNFDGIHKGHQALFQKVVELAEEEAGEALAITFEPHPLAVLRPDNPPKRICTIEHKAELIAKAHIDHLIVLPFNKELAQTSANDFVVNVLCGAIGIKHLVVGYDYALGKGRGGNIEFLKEMGDKFGFSLHVCKPVVVNGVVASSTKIRELVSIGDMRAVQMLLGRYYQIRGIVREGKRLGGPLIGFPTANLFLKKDELCPKTGVYVVQVIYSDKCYGGVMNIGFNPTFNETTLSAEVHIFDFDKEIYGHPLKVNLIERLRDERRFSGVAELSAQIALDAEKARLILASEPHLKRSCCEESEVVEWEDLSRAYG